jgi:hypothetical protein
MSGESPMVALTYEEAVALLPEGERVHTIIDGGVALLGADWDREDVLALLRTGRPELSGAQATARGHGLVAFPATGPVFIETRPANG